MMINKPANDLDILIYFVSLKQWLYQGYNPLDQIRVEFINGESARNSACLNPLGIAFDLQENNKEATLRRS